MKKYCIKSSYLKERLERSHLLFDYTYIQKVNNRYTKMKRNNHNIDLRVLANLTTDLICSTLDYGYVTPKQRVPACAKYVSETISL